MDKTLKELAELAGGTLDGDGSITINGVAGIKDAVPGQITFLANPKYLKDLKTTMASAVVVSHDTPVEGKAAIRAKNPYLAFSKIVSGFAPNVNRPNGIMQGAYVNPGAKTGHDVTIYPGVYVADGAEISERATLFPGVYVGEGSSIGKGSILYPNVVVREGVRVGARVIIHAGAVIGADGFGYATDGGKHHKIPQIGGVIIEDDVEVGANTTIDRGALGNTIIRRGTKIDNLVMVAHNVVVGEDSIICGQAGISGSTELGHHVVLAGQVGTVGHIKIGDGVMVGAKSGVSNDLDSGKPYSGIPAMPHKEWLRLQATLHRLPDLKKQLGNLVKRVDELDKNKENPGGD